MDENIKQIEDYLDGNLNAQELKAFEKRIEEDDALKAEVALYKDMKGGIRLRNNKLLKARLDEIHEEVIIGTRKKNFILSSKSWLAIAACLFLFILFYFLFPRNKMEVEDLYANYFVPYELEWVNRNSKADSLLIQLEQLYREKQYNKLLAFIENNSSIRELDQADVQLIQGIAKMETGSFMEANSYFQIVAQNPILKDEANWYRALNFLKEGRREECKQYLILLIEKENSDYYKDASQLLKEL